MKKITVRQSWAILLIAIALITISCSAQKPKDSISKVNFSGEEIQVADGTVNSISVYNEETIYAILEEKNAIINKYESSVFDILIGYINEADNKIALLEKRVIELEGNTQTSNFNKVYYDSIIDTINGNIYSIKEVEKIQDLYINHLVEVKVPQLNQRINYERKSDSLKFVIFSNKDVSLQAQYNILHPLVDSLYSIIVPVNRYYTKQQIDSILKL